MTRGAIVALAMLAACDEPAPPCAERAGFLCVLAGTGDYGFNEDGVPANEADLFLVSAARQGPDGLVWIMDFNNHRLRVIDADGTIDTRIGNGFHAIADVTVGPLDTPMENPIDFDFLADGRVVFVSYHDPRVIVLGLDERFEVIAGNGEFGMTGDEGDGGPAIDASFIQLDGIAVADDGTVYVSDSGAHRVRAIRDGVITTVAGDGQLAWTGDGGPASVASLNWPTALDVDDAGNLYIADTFNHAIRKIAADGTITTIAGDGGAGFSGDDGPAVAAKLSQPNGVAFDPADDSLYVADRANFRVRRIDADGTITTVAGRGTEGISEGDGPALDMDVGYLARVSIGSDPVAGSRDDAARWLLVADQSSSQVLRVNLR